MMKKILAVSLLVSMCGVAYAANGNPVVEMDYQTWVGNRDYQAYGGWVDMGTHHTFFPDPLGGPLLDLAENVSFRYTAPRDMDFDTIRLWFKSGGGGSTAPVTVWVEGNTSAADYYASVVGSKPSPEAWNGAWNIPDGVMKGGSATLDVSGAAAQYDFTLPEPVSLTAGEVFHIRLSVDADVVDPLNSNTKLRLAAGTGSANNPYRWRGNSNYTTGSGTPLNGGTAPNVKNGDDGMGALNFAVAYYGGSPLNVWAEGDFYNNGINDYAKYLEPMFELLYDYDVTGVGQGNSSQAAVAVTATPKGEVILADASMAGTVSQLGMFIKKGTATADLVISLQDAAGNTIASGSKAAVDIVNDTWVVVDIAPTTLVAGTTYKVVASSAGTGYSVYQNVFGALNFGPSNDASYGGTTSYSTENVSGDILFMMNVPEPATLGLLAFGGIAALIRRRR